MSVSHSEFERIWYSPIRKIGVPTLLVPAVLTFLPCLYLYMAYGVFPSLSVCLTSWGMIAAIFGANYILEPVSFYPVLGLSGTYISFLSGNIGNMRLPCSATAQDVVGVEPASQEAEIISTLGITGSVVTNLIFVSVAAVAGAAILNVLPGPVADAFKLYAVPAIFGGMFGQFVLKYPHIAIFGIGIPLGLSLGAIYLDVPFIGKPYVVIVCAVFGCISIGRVLYKKGIIKH